LTCTKGIYSSDWSPSRLPYYRILFIVYQK